MPNEAKHDWTQLERYQLCANYMNDQTQENWEKLRAAFNTRVEVAAPYMLKALRQIAEYSGEKEVRLIAINAVKHAEAKR